MSYSWLAFVATAGNFARNASLPYSLGEAYPVSRNGMTFGFVTGADVPTTCTMANFTGTGYPKTAPGPDLYSGRASISTAGKVFRLDLPDGPGTYRAKVSVGNKLSSLAVSIGCYEDAARASELFHAIGASNPPAGGSIDAAGNIHATPDAWWAAIDQDDVAGGGQYVEFTTDNDHVYFTLYSGYGYINAIGLEFQAGGPSPIVTLSDLSLSTGSFDITGAQPGDPIAAIQGLSPGSAIALDDTQGGQIDIDPINGIILVGAAALTAGSKTVALTETLTGATNTPHSSSASIQFVAGGGGGGGSPGADVIPVDFATRGAQMGNPPIDTVYAGQPEFEPFCKLLLPSGTTFANLSITGGGLSSYLRLKNWGGGVVGLEHTGVRIPDNIATRTLNILDSSSSHTTNLSFANVVTSPGRPTTGDHGDMPTQIWNERKKIHDMVFNNAWRGYAGEAVAQTVQVNSTSSFAQAWNNLTPNGTGWYVIEFAAGTYEGNFGSLSAKNFGAGGVLFTRASGADPEINFYGSFKGARNIDFGDLRYPGRPTVTPDPKALNKTQFLFLDPNASSTTVYHRICTSDVRAGYLHSDAAIADMATGEQNVVNQTINCYNDFILIQNAESYWEDGADFRGGQNLVKCFSTRYAMRRPRITKPNQDIGVFTQVYGMATKKGIYADDDCYAWYEPLLHNVLDYDGLNSSRHSDVNQFRTFNSGKSPLRRAGAGWGANSGATSPFNTSNHSKMISPINGTVWQVVSVGTTGLVAGDAVDQMVPPEMTADPATLTIGQQVQDGDVLFKYIGQAPAWGCRQYLAFCNAGLHGGNYSATGLPASFQLCINSNAGYGYPSTVYIENTAEASPNARGIENGNFVFANIGGQSYCLNPNLPRNEVWGWRAGFLPPANSNKRIDPGKFWATVQGTDLFYRKCIVAKVDVPSAYTTQNEFDNLVIPYGAVSPGSHLRGGAAFQHISKSVGGFVTNYYGFPGFVDNGYDHDAFEKAFSSYLHHNTGDYGPRLREEYTVVLQDNLGNQITKTLSFAPKLI